MRWFIIRDKVTGKHLPTRTGRKMSYTSLELTDEKPPRLFAKKSHATQAMACWCKGLLMPRYIEPRTDKFGFDLMDMERTNQYDIHEVEGRDKADLEVVEIRLEDV